MRRFIARIDADIFGYNSVTVETDRIGVSDSGDLLFYTDQGGINRVAYTIAEGLWFSCTEIDKEGNSMLKLTFNESVAEEEYDESDTADEE